jgi:Flp pilus assembly protein TadG
MFDLSVSRKIISGTRQPRPCVAPWAFLADTQGVAAVELALCLPMLILMMMGVVDFGTYAYDAMQVNAAAFAGAAAAVAEVQNGQSCNATNIATAVQSATPLGTSISAGTPLCGYAGYVNASTNTSTYTLSNTCANTCATPGSYAVVSAHTAFSPLLSWSGLVLPKTISATAMVRYG